MYGKGTLGFPLNAALMIVLKVSGPNMDVLHFAPTTTLNTLFSVTSNRVPC